MGIEREIVLAIGDADTLLIPLPFFT
jgi:hypothetical protein